MSTIEFEYEHEIEIKDADGEVIDTEYVTKTYSAEYSIDPGQDGGWDDPSWRPYAFLDGDIKDAAGNVVDDPAIEKAAKEAIDEIDIDDSGYEPEPDYDY